MNQAARRQLLAQSITPHFEQLEARDYLAASIFDVLTPAEQASYNDQFNAIRSGAGATLANQFSSSIELASEQAFQMPDLSPSVNIKTGHGALVTDLITDNQVVEIDVEREQTYFERLKSSAQDVYSVLHQPDSLLTMAGMVTCTAALGFTGVGIAAAAPVCLYPGLAYLELKLMAQVGQDLAEQAGELGASQKTVSILDSTFELIDKGADLAQLGDLARSATTARNASSQLALGIDAIYSGLGNGAQLVSDTEEIFQDLFRRRGGEGQDVLIRAALEANAAQDLLSSYAEGAFEVGNALSDEAKMHLRAMGLNDPDILAFSGVSTQIQTSLPTLLGTTPTAEASMLEGGTLQIIGSSSRDVIQISEDFANDLVEVNSNGTTILTVPVSDVSRLSAMLYEGDDTLTIGPSLDFPTIVYAGPGNDLLTGGPGDDVFYGERGNDRLYPGNGDDIAIGGDGDDEIILGNGLDIGWGGQGSNTITDRDNDDPLYQLADSLQSQTLTTSVLQVETNTPFRLDTHVNSTLAPEGVRFYRDDGNTSRVYDAGDTNFASTTAFVDGRAHATTSVSTAGIHHFFAIHEFADGSLSEPMSVFVNAFAPDNVPPTADILDISSPRSSGPSSVDIVFSEFVTGVTVDDFELRRDGTLVSIEGATLFTSNGRTHVLSGFSSDLPGEYELRLVAQDSGIQDSAGNALAGDASEAWRIRQNEEGPYFFALYRSGDLAILVVQDNFDVSTLDYQDLTLTLNDNTLTLDNSVSITPIGASQFEIDLGIFDDAEGLYKLTASGEEVFDNDGNPGTGNPSVQWVNGTIPKGVIEGTLRDTSGNGLVGRQVYIDANDNRQIDAGEQTSTTDGAGNYLFGDLDPGDYVIRAQSTAGYQQQSPTRAHGDLYLAEDGANGFVYYVDVAGQTLQAVAENRAWGSNLGLAQTPTRANLLGTAPRPLIYYSVNDGDHPPNLGAQGYSGLAYDYDENVYYGAEFGSVYTIDIATGTRSTTLPAPPVGTISGLTYANGKLYALGSVSYLLSYDIAEETWTRIGVTGLWDENFGLAHDPFTDTFYAIADGDSNLYHVNIATAEVTPLFDTGIEQGGGLAVVGYQPVAADISIGIGTRVVQDFVFQQQISPAPTQVDLISDTGISDSDDLTKLNNSSSDASLQFVVSGVTPNALVEIRAGDVVIGSATASTSEVSITTNGELPLPDGLNAIDAIQTMVGMATSEPATLDILIDSSPPSTPQPLELHAESDSGVVGDQITSDSTPTFEVDLSSTYLILANGVSDSGDYESGATYTTPEKVDGIYTWSVVATDDAGNLSAPSTGLVVQIDTQSPPVPTIDGFSENTGDPTDQITTDTTPEFFGTAEPNSTVTLLLNGVEIAQGVAPDSAWTLLVEDELDIGLYDVKLKSEDSAGNATESAVIQTEIQSEPEPTIDVGATQLRGNASAQRIPIYGSNLFGLTGININAQLGDGLEVFPEPIFSGIDLAGSIFENFDTTQTGGPVNGAPQFFQGSIILTNPADDFSGDGLLFTLLVDTTGFNSGVFDLKLGDTQIGIDTVVIGRGGTETPINITNGSIDLIQATAIGFGFFYNNSAWDDREVEINANDAQAIATDKSALRPGSVAGVENVTSHPAGITGVYADINGLGTIALNEILFRAGNTQTPSTWTKQVSANGLFVQRGAGTDGSDRVFLGFESGSVVGEWLQMTILPGGTGLNESVVAYFGNAPGSAMNGPYSPVDFTVNGTDFAAARDNQTTFLDPASIENPYDFNRDKAVNGTDMAIARDNVTNFLTKLVTLNLASQSESISFAFSVGVPGTFTNNTDERRDDATSNEAAQDTALDELLYAPQLPKLENIRPGTHQSISSHHYFDLPHIEDDEDAISYLEWDETLASTFIH